MSALSCGLHVLSCQMHGEYYQEFDRKYKLRLARGGWQRDVHVLALLQASHVILQGLGSREWRGQCWRRIHACRASVPDMLPRGVAGGDFPIAVPAK